MKPYINNIPEEIYLQIVGDYDGECDFDFEDLQESEITWSQEQIFKNDYKYVLEDRLKNRIIDKACEIYRKELTEIINIFNHLGKELYDIDEIGELISLEGSVNDFIKAMKGE